ncbi:MAG: hypothetical protein II864_10865 [Prevotella sp.]|nr:hypothetical protein [Prevotella sp.]
MKTRKICTSMTALLLALLVIQLTVGVTFAHCMHSGRNFIVSTTEMAGRVKAMMPMGDKCANTDCAGIGHRQCMEYSVKHLSASVEAPVFHQDFVAVQPLLFTFWDLVPPTAEGAALPQDVFCPDKVPIPPRAYLAHIRVLII